MSSEQWAWNGAIPASPRDEGWAARKTAFRSEALQPQRSEHLQQSLQPPGALHEAFDLLLPSQPSLAHQPASQELVIDMTSAGAFEESRRVRRFLHFRSFRSWQGQCGDLENTRSQF